MKITQLFKRQANPYCVDTSPRSTSIMKSYKVFVAAIIVIAISLASYIAGTIKYNSVVASSSTPVGAQMKFKRSDATVRLTGIYTDKSNSVLVARLSPQNAADGTKIPSKGTDYTTFVSSKAIPKEVKQIDMLTGKLSSDGDMFVVLPKPDPDAVYSVFIMNNNYLGGASDSRALAPRKRVADLTDVQGSLTSVLSQYNYDESAGENQGAYEIAGDNSDVIGFRLTLSPSLSGAQYKPSVIPKQLLSKSGVFDYKTFFDEVFINNAVKKLGEEYQAAQTIVNSKDAQIKEYRERIERNPDDADAKNALTNALREKQDAETDKTNVFDKLFAYRSLTYNDKLFAYTNTKGIVLRK